MPGNNIEVNLDTNVHYHLSSNVKFDKEDAFNGTKDIGGTYTNLNIKEFSVIINYHGEKNFINSNDNEEVIQELKSYRKIMINNISYDLELVNNNNLEIRDYREELSDGKYNFSVLMSIDNKGNIDKTYSGITSNIFSKEKQFYHGGSKSGYDADKIVEDKSFTLFYTKDNIADINNENSILIGLGQIQNKIGVLDTSDRIKGSKIYCYNHYKENDENKKYYLFRFPYQELIAIKESNESAKQFLEELIEPLSIENSDKPFFSYEQSKIIPNALVLKYANRLYEQIMKLRQNGALWAAVQDASDGKNWHFCDNDYIEFLKVSIEKLKEAQLNQKNPGLWALKEYFQINSGNEYNDFLKMCAGKIPLNNKLVLFNSLQNNFNTLKNFILENLIKYPIANKKTIQRIFTHLGLKAVYIKKTEAQKISTDLSELIINGKTIQELLDRVNENKKIENDNSLFSENNKQYAFKNKKDEINTYLYKNGFCEINKFFKEEESEDTICLKYLENYKIKIDRATNIQEIVSLEELKTNPYLLFEKYIQSDDAPLLLDDIDWGQKIILKEETVEDKKFKKDNPYRLRAIIVEYIKKQENQTGHVWVSYEDAQEYLNDRLYELDGDDLKEFYLIKNIILNDKFSEIFEIKDEFLTLKEFANRETYINNVISGLINSSHQKQTDILEKLEKKRQENPKDEYIESNLSLLKMKELDFVFISGVAGSGKSHTLCKYLDYLCGEKEENKPIDPNDFQVLTPSGKAANVIKNKIKENKKNFPNIFKYFYNDDQTEKVEEEAGDPKKNILFTRRVSTAHRFIVDSGKFWNQKLFATVDDGSEPTEDIDVLIIDEISMITLDTLYYILKIKKPNKLIILGDIKQLPPIGYGSLATSIYNHLFLESSFQDICLAKMETSHRADDNSLFIKHSLTLRDKDKQLKKEDLEKNKIENLENIDNEANFILIPYSNESNESNKTIGEIIKEIYNKEAMEANNEAKEDNKEAKEDNKEANKEAELIANIRKMNKKIQILTPNRIGESGTYAINNIFKDALDDTKVGLKFIYNKNDKETGLSNGTMGYIEDENNKKIKFDDKLVDYIENSPDSKYELGFAITVHKSQGSGFPIVILVLPEKNNSLITKELIYTALTRPEEKMYILYHKKNIKALTHLPSIPHRNMNLFDRDKLFWIKDEIEYPITYNNTEYRRKQDLYFALMLEYAGKKNVTYHKNGAFVWEEEIEKLLMPKFYIKEKQDEKSFKYLKSIDLQEVYENFEFKLGGVKYELLPKRKNENKEDIIEDNKELIEITTHNGLKTRSWSEAILMLIFDNLKIPYFYEVEIRRENDANTYKLTYPKPDNEKYRIPDFTISSEKIDFTEENKKSPIVVNDVKCIIEHLGMLTNDSYKKGWKEKVKDYYDEKKYDFKVITPLRSLSSLSSLTKDDSGKYFVSEIWEIDKDKPTEQQKSEISIEKQICFTTDEEDLKNIQELIVEKLILLKNFYSLNS